MSLGVPLSAAEAAIFESLVVPRYMRTFAIAAANVFIPYAGAQVVHLGCRTGFFADVLSERVPGCTLVGVDNSPAALELARTKAAMLQGVTMSVVQADGLPTTLEPNLFTHAVALHPAGERGDHSAWLAELFRVLAPGGQLIAAMPLRGSFASLYDMLREYAVGHKQPRFGEAVEAAASGRPNPETLAEQCEGVGFSEVDVVIDLVGATFERGREFLEDPISRLVVGPDVRESLPTDDGADEAMRYAANALAKYYSEIPYELRVNIGCVSARRL